MNRPAKIALAATTFLTLCTAPVFADGVLGGSPSLGLAVEPSTLMALLGSGLFGSFYLISRGRK